METIINYNQDEKTASCYTHDKALIKKLNDFCAKSPDIYREKTEGDSSTYILPKKWIKIKFPRQLSDEKRAELKVRALSNFQNARKE